MGNESGSDSGSGGGWNVNVGPLQISDKGVEAKPQFKVGYHDKDGGFGGGVDFEKGVKVEAEAKAKIDGQQWGGGVDGGVEIDDGVKVKAGGDAKIHGYNVANVEVCHKYLNIYCTLLIHTDILLTIYSKTGRSKGTV